MNITPAFTQETAHPIGQYRRDFGDNRQRDFLRRFAADVESRRREQVSQHSRQNRAVDIRSSRASNSA